MILNTDHSIKQGKAFNVVWMLQTIYMPPFWRKFLGMMTCIQFGMAFQILIQSWWMPNLKKCVVLTSFRSLPPIKDPFQQLHNWNDSLLVGKEGFTKKSVTCKRLGKTLVFNRSTKTLLCETLLSDRKQVVSSFLILKTLLFKLPYFSWWAQNLLVWPINLSTHSSCIAMPLVAPLHKSPS